MSKRLPAPFTTRRVIHGLELALARAKQDMAAGNYSEDEERSIGRALGWLEEAKRKRAGE